MKIVFVEEYLERKVKINGILDVLFVSWCLVYNIWYILIFI